MLKSRTTFPPCGGRARGQAERGRGLVRGRRATGHSPVAMSITRRPLEPDEEPRPEGTMPDARSEVDRAKADRRFMAILADVLERDRVLLERLAKQ